jgi:molybdopterin synthase catalytic subunit
LSYEVLEITQLTDFAKDKSAGAVTSFQGTTRDFFEDKVVVGLSYEAYSEMALKQMRELINKVTHA